MCYEMWFTYRKSAKGRQPEKAAPVIEQVPAAEAPGRPQPEAERKETPKRETELETTPA
jgi:hypothetical protein